uniref:Uncharacterized protein n=1 Tax=Bursaphelenchus xylophilus TaxID=6326 RepID=A0A1I7RQP4_BURXY
MTFQRGSRTAVGGRLRLEAALLTFSLSTRFLSLNFFGLLKKLYKPFDFATVALDYSYPKKRLQAKRAGRLYSLD